MLRTDGEPQTDARRGRVLQGEPHAGSAGRRDRSRPEAVAWSSRAGEGAVASGREAPGKDARPPVCLADGLGGRPPEPGLPSGGAEGSPTYGGPAGALDAAGAQLAVRGRAHARCAAPGHAPPSFHARPSPAACRRPRRLLGPGSRASVLGGSGGRLSVNGGRVRHSRKGGAGGPRGAAWDMALRRRHLG